MEALHGAHAQQHTAPATSRALLFVMEMNPPPRLLPALRPYPACQDTLQQPHLFFLPPLGQVLRVSLLLHKWLWRGWEDACLRYQLQGLGGGLCTHGEPIPECSGVQQAGFCIPKLSVVDEVSEIHLSNRAHVLEAHSIACASLGPTVAAPIPASYPPPCSHSSLDAVCFEAHVHVAITSWKKGVQQA